MYNLQYVKLCLRVCKPRLVYNWGQSCDIEEEQNVELGEKLSILRRQKGYSQQELAEHLNVSRQAVSMWESGATFPSTDNLYLLSRLYGVTIDEILDRTPLKDEAEVKAEDRKTDRHRCKMFVFPLTALIAIAIAIVMAFAVQDKKEEAINIDETEKESVIESEIWDVDWRTDK